jgi:hypothetical protein
MLKIFKDPNLQNLPDNCLPPNWSHRLLFHSHVGANEWLDLGKAEGYYGADEKDPCVIMYKQCLCKIGTENIDLFVSLGPGDGRIDQQLVMRIKRNVPNLRYIAVDISETLLEKSSELMYSNSACMILGDFEDGMDFIASIVRERRKSAVLWSMLGNSLGGLDIPVKQFMFGLSRAASRGDLFFFSVALSPLQLDKQLKLWEKKKRLAACIIAYRRGEISETVIMEYADRMRLRPTQTDDPASSAVEFYDDQTGEVAFVLRCFDLDKLVEWLCRKAKLQVLDTKVIRPPNVSCGVGAALLKFEKDNQRA